MNHKKISAVSFDLWGTLIKDTNNMMKKRSQCRINNIEILLSKINSEVSKTIIKNSLNYVREKCTEDHNNEFDISFHDRVTQLINLISKEKVINSTKNLNKLIGQIIDNAFLAYPPYLVEGAEETIEKINEKGYLMCLISNTGFTSPNTYNIFLEKIGLSKHIKIILLSNEIQIAKPSKKIFDLAIKKLGVPNKEIIHIGDNYQADIIGSKNCGIKPLWINGDNNSINKENEKIIIKSIPEILGFF
jgi:FMN phosphatase YigB (HAD superfamily)